MNSVSSLAVSWLTVLSGTVERQEKWGWCFSSLRFSLAAHNGLAVEGGGNLTGRRRAGLPIQVTQWVRTGGSCQHFIAMAPGVLGCARLRRDGEPRSPEAPDHHSRKPLSVHRPYFTTFRTCPSDHLLWLGGSIRSLSDCQYKSYATQAFNINIFIGLFLFSLFLYFIV